MQLKVVGFTAMGVFAALNSFHAALLFYVFSYIVRGENVSTFFNGHVQAVGWFNFFLNLISAPGIMAPIIPVLDRTKGSGSKGMISMSVVLFVSSLAKFASLICMCVFHECLYTVVDVVFGMVAMSQMFVVPAAAFDYYWDSRKTDTHGSDLEAPQPAERDCPTTIAASMDTASIDADSMNTVSTDDTSTDTASTYTVYDGNKEYPV